MSDYNIDSKQKAEEEKRKFINSIVKEMLVYHNEPVTEDEVNRRSEVLLKEVGSGPLFQARQIMRNEIPFKEDFIADMRTISEDLSILSKENELHAEFLRDSFNSVHSEKKRIMQRIDSLNSLAGDMFLITDKENNNIHYITESFNDSKALDTDFSIGSVSKGSIQTQEGILTLERTASRNLSETARITHISGNGEPGTNQIARKFTTVDENGEAIEAYRFLNQDNKDQHTKIENILDDKPDTLFEYQMINVPKEFKKKRRFYNFDWAEGEKEGERLRLKLVIELPKEEYINWLTLMPYYPNNSIGSLTVHSIRTSVNGFDYEPLYTDTIINKDINITPQTYRLDDIFTGETQPGTGFYQGKGVWSFPQRKARLIEIVLDQDESYHETLGQAVYYLGLEGSDNRIQIEEPAELAKENPGKHIRYLNGHSVEYTKVIEATKDAWRYSIGLRDINIMQFEFNEKSEFVSKRYELPRNIRKLNLYTKEIIPESYLDIVSKNNDWIKYEVSFDDVNWHRISPMHHEPLSDNFPPKILELNTSLIDLNNAFQVHKEIVESEEVKHLRFRVSLQRPEDETYNTTTPILEEIAFKIEMEDEL